VELMKGSTPAEGKTASHEAIYQFIYAMPRAEPTVSPQLIQAR